MDGPRDCHTEWSQPDTESDMMWYCFLWNPERNDTNELIYKPNRLTDWEWTCGYQGGSGGKG